MLSMVWRGESGYLTDHGDEREPVTTDYYTEAIHEPGGLWWGPGAELLGLEGVATREQMEAIYDRLETLDGKPLGSRPRKYPTLEARLARLIEKEPTEPSPERLAKLQLDAKKAHRESRHYIDATFSPGKSWSVLHAALSHAGRHDEAERVWDCWMEGVKAGLEYWMAEAGVSRMGGGVRLPNGNYTEVYPEARGWVMSFWRHHTSRDGDPQLHVHVAILNRVMCPDGQWRALFGQGMKDMRPAVGAVTERVAEEALSREFGVSWQWEGEGREIVGIDSDIRDLFSSRSRARDVQAERLIAEYEAQHGVEPSAYTRRLIAEQAVLLTRQRKPKHQLTPEQRVADWEARLRRLQDQSFARVLNNALTHHDAPPERFDRQHVIEASIAAAAGKRSEWTRAHLIFELRKHLPNQELGVDPAEFIDDLADEALASAQVVTLSAPDLVTVPDELRRSDGGHIFERQRPERYASTEQLGLEDELEQLFRAGGAPHMPAPFADALAKAEPLSINQAEALRRVLSSDQWVMTMLGPAGAGKSHTVAAITRAWSKGFQKDTYGLGLSQAAAKVLQSEGVSRTSNIKRWLDAQEFLDTVGREGTKSPKIDAIREKFGVRKGELVVVDESSMVDTAQMRAVTKRVRAAGARLLLVGDQEQAEAIGPAGAFGLALANTQTIELIEIWRFRDMWEGPASLLLRQGDDRAILEYERYGRFVSGPADAMSSSIANAAVADLIQGKNAAVITVTNEEASRIASEIREMRARLGQVETEGLALADGTVAGVNDLVTARKTKREVHLGAVKQDELVNRETYLVTGRGSDDTLRVKRLLGRDDNGVQCYEAERVLPAWYVAEHVSLAYASTVHAAQGRTTDTSYVLVGEGMTWRSFYVALTRGREHNVAYIITKGDQHRHEVLVGMAEKARQQLSATETRDLEWRSVDHMAAHGTRLAVLKERSRAVAYDRVMAALLSPEEVQALRGDVATASLYRLIRSAELDGRDPHDLVASVVEGRRLDDAESIAKVLHFRIEKSLGTVSRETSADGFIPHSYSDGIGRQESETVERYAYDLAAEMDSRRSTLGQLAAADVPAYLHELGPVPGDMLAREEWEARAGEVEAYRERWGIDREDALGPCPNRGNPERRAEWQSAYKALGCPPELRPMAERTDGELRRLIAVHERQKHFEPLNVDEAMSKALRNARDWHSRSVRERARADTLAHDEAAKAQATAERHQRFADEAARKAEDLRAVAEVRTEWLTLTQEDREAHDAAHTELRRRYPSAADRDRAAEREAVRDEAPPGTTDPDTARERINGLREQVHERENERRQRQDQARPIPGRDSVERDSR